MSKVVFESAERIKKLPPYLFAEIDRKKSEAISQGRDIIDMGVGDPDLPTPDPIIESLYSSAKDPANHQYPSYRGMAKLREEIALWYKRRFNVDLDPETEVLPLIGSKEGIAHVPLALVNPGDVVLVPDPGYPVYNASTILAGGTPYFLPLKEENGFLPDLDNIDKSVLDKAKIIFLNYPNNPTSAVADKDFYEKAIRFAEENNILICHDSAYSEIAYDGYKPLSFMEVEGSKNVGIEFHSLSKTYNMTGWRIGFAVGNKDAIALLGKVKTNIDSGIFQAVQYAGITALNLDPSIIDSYVKIYQERRDILGDGLNDLGWKIEKPKATFYLWTKVPEGYNSIDFSGIILDKADIVCTPGVGFGGHGDGFIRFALTQDKRVLDEVLNRLGNLKI